MPIQLLDKANGGSELFSDPPRVPESGTGFYVTYGKRAFDTLLAGAALVLLSPVLGIVACLIRLTSRGPALYRQQRVGKDGLPFQILKFRSMVTQAPKSALSITVAGDPRVTPLGKMLRRFKADELPQLWNVLCGEMSLVGPRPELAIFVSAYTPDQRIVLSALPGITDPASLEYRHEETILAEQSDPEHFYRTKILPDKLARNRAYLQRITFREDVRIVLKTILAAVLSSRKTQPRSRQ